MYIVQLLHYDLYSDIIVQFQLLLYYVITVMTSSAIIVNEYKWYYLGYGVTSECK